LGADVIDTEKYGFQQDFHRHLHQYTKLIVAVQPSAFFPLLATPTRLVCGIEILILVAFLDVQISQHHDAWICEFL
jgi:hypothetical protein